MSEGTANFRQQVMGKLFSYVRTSTGCRYGRIRERSRRMLKKAVQQGRSE